MKVFDDVDAAKIDRREIHLRVLGIAIISVLAVGLAIMMYPAVFARPVALSGTTFQILFFAFCTLAALLIAYLVDRHMLVSKLRLDIVARERAIQFIQHQASEDFLASLPGLDTFQDRLAMEFRRASSAAQPLSLLAVETMVPAEIGDPEKAALQADAGRAILRRIRGADSMFLLEPAVFAILLPRISTSFAELIKGRIEQELREEAGAIPRFRFRAGLLNYPDHVGSAHELLDVIFPTLATQANSVITSTVVVATGN